MARRNTLRIPDDGPCAGHPCDDCERCLAGDCCGCDVGEAGLPLEGSWPHQAHGAVGVLVEQRGRLQCHCCGGWFEELSRHVRSHGLSADAYRSMWGLNCTTALAGERLRAQRAGLGHQHGHRLGSADRLEPTAEQRSAWARAREARAQTVLARGSQPRSRTGRWAATPGKYLARRPPAL